jgi:hypothetical protein
MDLILGDCGPHRQYAFSSLPVPLACGGLEKYWRGLARNPSYCFLKPNHSPSRLIRNSIF